MGFGKRLTKTEKMFFRRVIWGSFQTAFSRIVIVSVTASLQSPTASLKPAPASLESATTPWHSCTCNPSTAIGINRHAGCFGGFPEFLILLLLNPLRTQFKQVSGARRGDLRGVSSGTNKKGMAFGKRLKNRKIIFLRQVISGACTRLATTDFEALPGIVSIIKLYR